MTDYADYTLARESILGAMLIDERVIGEVITAIKPGDFLNKLDRDIFTAARSLFLDGEKVDPVTVLAKIGSSPELRDRTLQVMDLTPTAANITAYIKIVRDESRRIKIRAIGQKLAELGTLEDAQGLADQLQELLVNHTGIRSLSMSEALSNFYDRIKEPRLFLTWGFDFLDEGLYAEAGDFIILGGRPSDGKTALALAMAYHQAKTKRVGFFSLETREDKLFDRLYSSVARVDSSHIKRRQLTEEDHEALASKAEEIKDRNLHLIKASGMTVYDIQAYARSRRFEIIYVDYLQLVQADGKNRTEQVTNISIGFHTLAQSNDMTVVALSQLSREGDGGKESKKKDVRPPRLRDLRESGQIEQDADIVLFVYREEPDRLRSRRILSVAKNKEGSLGQVPLFFNGEIQTFRPDPTGMPDDDDAPPRKRQTYPAPTEPEDTAQLELPF